MRGVEALYQEDAPRAVPAHVEEAIVRLPLDTCTRPLRAWARMDCAVVGAQISRATLASGMLRVTAMHWYEAHGIG